MCNNSRLPAALESAALRLNLRCSSARSVAGDRFEEDTSEKHADQVALVFGAALMIVDEISSVGDQRCRFGQPFFDFDARACKQRFRRQRPAGTWADATDRHASRAERSAAVGSFE